MPGMHQSPVAFGGHNRNRRLPEKKLHYLPDLNNALKQKNQILNIF